MKPMNDEQLIQEINFLKNELGVSYKQIAKLVGITQQTLYKFLTGEAPSCIGYEKKERLKRVINNYKQVKIGQKGDK
jgi:predicted transcriptional regulator